MVSLFSRISKVNQKFPIIRGIVSYAIICPTGSLVQQTYAGKTYENYDWKQALRYSLYGALFTAPTLYCWVRISTVLWPQATLKTAITKALAEQVSYGPFSITSFYFLMPLLEGSTIEFAKSELNAKFVPTFKGGICFWPFVQTLNFFWIPEKNRVPFVSACSLFWWTFLAYMHKKDIKENSENLI